MSGYLVSGIFHAENRACQRPGRPVLLLQSLYSRSEIEPRFFFFLKHIEKARASQHFGTKVNFKINSEKRALY